MMTSINPKNIATTNNVNYGKITPTTNNLIQRNNYGMEKEGMDKLNFNPNYNMANQNYSFQRNDNINDLSNLNKKNNVNLNSGLQGIKNYSTPILNEGMSNQNNYKRSMDFYDKNQQNLMNQNKMETKNIQRLNDNDYMDEIEKLKMEIANLKKNNEFLNNQLMEEKRKNQQIQNSKGMEENSILGEIAQCIQVSSVDEILPKLNEIINFLNNNINNISKNNNKDNGNKIRDELISKLQNLYLSLTGSNEKKEEISIKILWRWIKHLINTVKQLALEKEKNIEIYQNMHEIDEYKEYCEELMGGFNLQTLDELKMFIDDLLKQNNLIKETELPDQKGNIGMGPNPMNQRKDFQLGQNYQEEEENDEGEEMVEGEMEGDGEEGGEGEIEGDVEGEGEGEEEGIDENNNELEQYDNEIMQQKMNMQNNRGQ